MCVRNTSLVLFGGFDGSKWLNDLHTLNTISLVWTQPKVIGLAPEVRQYHSSAVILDRMFVFGGYNGVTWLNDLVSLNFGEMSWTHVRAKGDVPTAKEGHAMVTVERCLYVYGGWDGAAVSDLHRFDTVSDTWEKLTVLGSAPAVCGHSMDIVDGKIYVFGGYTGKGWSGSMHRLTLSQSPLLWEPLKILGSPKPRGYHSSVVLSRFILIYAGYNGSHILGDLLAFDTDTQTWSYPDPYSKHSLVARNAHTMTRLGSELYLFGGYNGQRDTNDLHVLESAAFSTLHDDITRAWTTDLWKDVLLVGGREKRRVHGAILRARCPFLYAEMALECPDYPERPGILELPHISKQGFDAFCEFLYTDTLKASMSSETMEELSSCADHFHLPRLRLLCLNNPEVLESTFSNDIMKIRSYDDLSDLTILVEGQVFLTHRFLLSCRCPYFKAMFQYPMKEQQSKMLKLPGISAGAFSLVLEWIYSDKFSPLFATEEIDTTLGLHLLRDVSVLALESLTRMTEIVLQRQVTAKNVCQMLDFSLNGNAQKLKASCVNFTLKNFEKIDKRDLQALSTEAQALLNMYLPKSLQKQANQLPTQSTLVRLESQEHVWKGPTSTLLNIKGEKLGAGNPTSVLQREDRVMASYRPKADSTLSTFKYRETQCIQGSVPKHPQGLFMKTGMRIVAGFHRSYSGVL